MTKSPAISVVLALLMSAPPASAQPWRVIDGDTVEIAGETVRIANIDTPEIKHAQCDAERRLGLVAKAELNGFLATGPITIQRGDPATGRQKDKYGRTLGLVTVGGRDAGEELIARQMARAWDGKRRSWCE